MSAFYASGRQNFMLTSQHLLHDSMLVYNYASFDNFSVCFVWNFCQVCFEGAVWITFMWWDSWIIIQVTKSPGLKQVLRSLAYYTEDKINKQEKNNKKQMDEILLSQFFF